MKLVVYALAGEARIGILDQGTGEIAPLDLSLSHPSLGIVEAIEASLSGADLSSLKAASGSVRLDQVEMLAPIPRPSRNVICVGKNYHEHAREFANSGFDSSATMGDVPKDPIIFTKVPECVIAHGEDIEFRPSVSEAIDYEVELAVIVGKPGYGVSKADAMDHVWGYTVINDVTARDWQQRHQQWHLGKSFPTFCPMGPVAVTADEIDLGNTIVRTTVNGEVRQESNTSDLIFDVPTLIECISTAYPLKTGDVIATGTPVGVGIGFSPPKYLKDGDRVVVEVEGIGRLENMVRAVK